MSVLSTLAPLTLALLRALLMASTLLASTPLTPAWTYRLAGVLAVEAVLFWAAVCRVCSAV